MKLLILALVAASQSYATEVCKHVEICDESGHNCRESQQCEQQAGSFDSYKDQYGEDKAKAPVKFGPPKCKSYEYWCEDKE